MTSSSFRTHTRKYESTRIPGAGAAGLGLTATALAEQLADQKPKRVGIIGPGWYGKSDLFRLIQVSPVEVVSMCDVDKQMLTQAAEMVADAPGIEEDASPLQRLPRDAQAEGSRHLPGRHARITGTRSP